MRQSSIFNVSLFADVSYWIDGSRYAIGSNTFVNYKNLPLTFTNWFPGEPGGSEDRIELHDRSSVKDGSQWGWNDLDRTAGRTCYFICQIDLWTCESPISCARLTFESINGRFYWHRLTFELVLLLANLLLHILYWLLKCRFDWHICFFICQIDLWTRFDWRSCVFVCQIDIWTVLSIYPHATSYARLIFELPFRLTTCYVICQIDIWTVVSIDNMSPHMLDWHLNVVSIDNMLRHMPDWHLNCRFDWQHATSYARLTFELSFRLTTCYFICQIDIWTVVKTDNMLLHVRLTFELSFRLTTCYFMSDWHLNCRLDWHTCYFMSDWHLNCRLDWHTCYFMSDWHLNCRLDWHTCYFMSDWHLNCRLD